jgi:hypothetical protein
LIIGFVYIFGIVEILNNVFYIYIWAAIISTILFTVPYFFYDLTKEKHDMCVRELKERLEKAEKEEISESELSKSITGLLWALGLGLYFFLSFTTSDWHITWVIFPITGALDSLVTAIVRTREAALGNVNFQNSKAVRKGLGKLIWAFGIAVYFLFSFATGAWYMSWLLLPITGAVHGLISAILDFKEAADYET